MKYNPHQYQEYSSKFIIDHPAAALLLDMGMGKTVSTLTAINDLIFDHFEIPKVLVIAPLRVAEDTWSRETQKWDHLKHLRISKILGPEKKRLQALNTEADIYVINRENVDWIVEQCFHKWPFPMVVIDELSSFKSPSAKRFKMLRRVRPQIKRIVGLTGTPAPNSLIDLWSQMYLLDQGERLGKSITGYRQRYFFPAKSNGPIVYEWAPQKEAEANIYKKISDICVSMSAKDWLEMPERIDNIVPIELTGEAREQYNELENGFILEMEKGDVVADNAAVLTNKLLQMANGAVYDEHGGVRKIHDHKIKALEDIIEGANGNPVLVFYSYKHDLERLLKYGKKLETSKDIQDWNDGKTPVLLAHPASAGHGLNLQEGGNTIVWFGLTWSLELYQQANARLHRQGQMRSVIVHHLVAEDTMDEDVMLALQRKETGQNALLEAVKSRLQRRNKECLS
jgi:SNF2 family DNA or RNA helicase